MALTTPQAAGIALNRFGLGARPDDAAPADAKGWLIGQFGRFEVKPAAFAALPDPGALSILYRDQVKALVQQSATARAGQEGMAPLPGTAAAMAPDPVKKNGREALHIELRDSYRMGVNARMTSALVTQAPFVERLATFWSNHFALSIEKPQVGIYAAAYEVEAIRPHVLGRFEDMLIAAETHPAMLFYLDQFQSIGPGSRAAQSVALHNPAKKRGLNENLAREIMELHTLGVRTGYDQADVTEFARALTGWTVQGDGPTANQGPYIGQTTFRPNMHEPGNRSILGRTYPDGGQEQSLAVLRDLAASPATARHISTKLARQFVADDPPPALVDRMTASYLKSGGDLPTLYRTLIDSPEAWLPGEPKFKTPWEWTTSALRGLGRRDVGKMDISAIQNQLGQPVWRPRQPIGYDDIAATWAAPDALMRRVELAQRFATMGGGEIDARALAPKLLPGTLGANTSNALAQAESGPTALALLLVSPEFQRR